MKTADFTIIGGGIAGLATAIALEQKGFSTEIFEAAPNIRAAGAGISLAPNAMLAMRRLGLEKGVAEKGRMLPVMSIRDSGGSLIAQTDGRQIAQKYGAAHYAIHRGDLHLILLTKLLRPAIHTGKQAVGADVKGKTTIVQFHDGTKHEARALIVADGIHSPIRRQLLPGSTARYAGYTCWRSVVEFDGSIPAEATETWGPRGRFGIVPLQRRQIYWFACKAAPANYTRYKNFTVEDINSLFKGYHEPIPEIIRQTSNAVLLWNDIIDLKPIPKFAFGNMVLIGDAAHATTPNLGQGACLALEDAAILAEEAARYARPEQAFRQFEKKRLERVHQVVRQSRALGRAAQIEHRLLAAMRNALFGLMPTSVAERQFKFLYEVDF